MQARLISFGKIEIDGQTYDHDVTIDGGCVHKRKKGPSKDYRDRYGHTPLSAQETISWNGKKLIIGTGAYGSLPVMPEVHQEAKRREVEILVVPTKEACGLLSDLEDEEVNAILHVTC